MKRSSQFYKPKDYVEQLVFDPLPGKMVTRWCIGLMILLVLTLVLPWTQTVRASGKLTTLRPQDRPQEIHSIIAGRIEEWYVQEGQFVHRGDTIVRLSETKEKFLDTALIERIQEQVAAKEGSQSSITLKIEALKRQIGALQTSRELSRNKAENKLRQAQFKIVADSSDLVASMADYEIASVQLLRADSLLRKGLISMVDHERRKLKVQESNAKRISLENKLLAARNEMLNASIEISSIEAEYLDKVSKAESDMNSTLSYLYETEGELSKMNNEYVSMQLRRGFYMVTAPQDGYVVQARVQGVGETVKEGDVIITIVPNKPQLAVELYVEAMDIPLLKVGQNVRLQFDGWPALVFSGWPSTSFGTFGGKVAVIDNMDTKGRYRILVVPDSEDVAWPEQVRMGSGARGWLLLKDVAAGYEIWRQINGFPPEYTGETSQKEIKEK
jgi:multidrug efflux pump subunit AcrA (membrane-fusion protein)